MRRSIVLALVVGIGGSWPVGAGHAGKKPKAAAAPAPVKQASAEAARAIGELVGKFKWGMSPEDAQKLVTDETVAKFDERIKAERDAFKQDRIRRELEEQLDKIKTSYTRFEADQHSGWDVSLIDHEFARGNTESMFVIWEKDQRRFLFFHDGKLWKQFIAFNADHPALKGKSFDEFADLMQKRYGPAATTFRKQRTSDEQAFDHLEWPPAGDNVLWAIDETMLYNNFCLSLFQKSAATEVERQRKEHGVKREEGHALVDAVIKPDGKTTTVDDNADIVDEITGRESHRGAQPAAPAPVAKGRGKKGAAPAPAPEKKHESSDPLEGTNF